jgi:hypothetical protein
MSVMASQYKTNVTTPAKLCLKEVFRKRNEQAKTMDIR